MRAKSITYLNQMEFIFKTQLIPRSMLSETVLIILGLIIGAFIHYSTPGIVSFFLQAVFFYFYLRSSKIYPWIFVLLFVSFAPGDLFGRTRPLIFITVPFLGIVSFGMAFILVSWIKVIKKRAQIIYKNSFLVIIIYAFLLLPIFGVVNVPGFLRGLIFFSWLLVLPRLINSSEDFDRLFYMIFIANILVFAFNTFQVLTGQTFARVIAGTYQPGVFDPDRLVRTVAGISFAHLAVAGGLLYLNKSKTSMSVILAYSGLVLGFLNIVYSGTRGWVFGTTFLIIAYSFFMIPRVIRNILFIVPVVAMTIIIAWNIPVIRSQIIGTYDRIIHREYLLDINPDTTEIGRIQRGTRVMNKFRESPILGFGFGEEGREYGDSHTGNQTLLLHFGIIGYLLFLNFWVGFLGKVLFSERFIKHKGPDYRINVLIAISFISIFIIHSTSGAFLHPFISAPNVIWYALIFAYGNYLYFNKQKNQLNISTKSQK